MQKYLSLDGFERSKEEDNLISQHIDACFKTPAGEQVLRYLRSITIEMVHGGAVSDAELRHAEGQRYIVGLIERRIQHSKKVKAND
jgi:hypothetical protein